MVHVGCAGWSLPRPLWPRFTAEGSHLARYAGRLGVVEIDSSFHRPHRRETYARWADSTPAAFRFSVKLPRSITHDARLEKAMPLFDAFLEQVDGLGTRLGCLVVQLPPSLAFAAPQVRRFAADLRARYAGEVAVEPRHASWFAPAADALLARWRMARVLADPVLFDSAAAPGGWPGLIYLRLHGSPRRYWSSYDDALIDRLAQRLKLADAPGTSCWCIFDNTASGAATANALALQDALGKPGVVADASLLPTRGNRHG